MMRKPLSSISHRLGVGMSADAANTSVCATASNAGCRISAWRTHSCVPRPHSCGRLCLKCDEKSRLAKQLRHVPCAMRNMEDSDQSLLMPVVHNVIVHRVATNADLFSGEVVDVTLGSF